MAHKAVEKEPDNVNFLITLGEVLHRTEDHDNAEVILLKSYNLSIATSDNQNLQTTKIVNLLIQLYEAWGKPEEAEKWQAKLLQTETVEE
jgi:lipopolysaccharide biosynthesis regulator YciM